MTMFSLLDPTLENEFEVNITCGNTASNQITLDRHLRIRSFYWQIGMRGITYEPPTCYNTSHGNDCRMNAVAHTLRAHEELCWRLGINMPTNGINMPWAETFLETRRATLHPLYEYMPGRVAEMTLAYTYPVIYSCEPMILGHRYIANAIMHSGARHISPSVFNPRRSMHDAKREEAEMMEPECRMFTALITPDAERALWVSLFGIRGRVAKSFGCKNGTQGGAECHDKHLRACEHLEWECVCIPICARKVLNQRIEPDISLGYPPRDQEWKCCSGCLHTMREFADMPNREHSHMLNHDIDCECAVTYDMPRVSQLQVVVCPEFFQNGSIYIKTTNRRLEATWQIPPGHGDMTIHDILQQFGIFIPTACKDNVPGATDPTSREYSFDRVARDVMLVRLADILQAKKDHKQRGAVLPS